MSALADDSGVNTNQKHDIKYRFGKAIRRRRRELDLSQEELAERSELHRTYISSIERGQRNPSLENIEKIAQALRISISDLFAKYSVEDVNKTDE